MRIFSIAVASAAMLIAAPAFAQAPSAALKAAVAAPSRTDANRARDQYRHPAETLAFFGVKPTDTVVEIWPGGGWYTEILGPYLAANGQLILANAGDKMGKTLTAELASDPAIYGKVQHAAFPSVLGGTGVAPGTADVVLTFRNVHNWRGGYQTADKQDYSLAAFKEMYAMLKPGGTLGVVDHRLPEKADAERERTSGYMKVSTIRRLAEEAGFKFVGASEVNANPKDTADWAKGVWTLPPTYANGETDRAKYQAIGESDRMTLKFVKPKA
ncbi:methyltransferase [Sphingomonas sp. MAH-20]|jgi:predicted methyltransferase|uniref:Methyltransferase n=1 Tax=Sphingomonas horti TaxID=2682842 RepID=A0A6I4IZ71_9SPHN|nr:MULTISPECIES: methyltransferase [Sphingomonas]MBA2918490.1 class I SAM-dependent methyltransferase [Sphingomonas sp. CGMCC 1.13658]MVO77457.1 methyltransferase [Sphingomonas horti]